MQRVERTLRSQCFAYMRKKRISSTRLARSVGDVLACVRYRGESFVIEKNGKGVALLSPLPEAHRRSLREIAEAWRSQGPPDEDFAALLEQVGRTDGPEENPWESSSTRAP